MTAILGLSALYHDSAAALMVDGKIVAAAQEERFTRIKHDDAFPDHAIRYCLDHAGIDASQLDCVGFYEKPLVKFERLMETWLSVAPRGFRPYARAVPLWVGKKLHLRRVIRQGLGKAYRNRIVFAPHHLSHAASAFFPSPFDRAAVLTVDGVGEWSTTAFGVGEGNRVRLAQEIRFPHSLGLLYSAFTYYCGFRVNSGEYKLMGLAPYGQPRYADLIRERLVRIHDDGSFHLDGNYFGYGSSLRMTTPKFHRLFGREPRSPEAPIESLDKDLAASIQSVTEEILLKMARHVHRSTGERQLCLAGGVALNCVANGRLLREGPFDEIWIQPAAGDCGGALGIAQLIWFQLMNQERTADPDDAQHGSLLGPEYQSSEVRELLDCKQVDYRHVPDSNLRNQLIADWLAQGKVVGRFVGRAEFGPRALGNRSILGDPRMPAMQSRMNRKIKFRESFRPFGPAVLQEHARDYFGLNSDASAGERSSPYMLLVCPVHGDGLPAVTHVDGSARVQTVDDFRNPGFASLLKAFEIQTGCPVLINTSFNVRGEPIVGSPEDALRCYLATGMDALVIEDCLLEKAS